MLSLVTDMLLQNQRLTSEPFQPELNTLTFLQRQLCFAYIRTQFNKVMTNMLIKKALKKSAVKRLQEDFIERITAIAREMVSSGATQFKGTNSVKLPFFSFFVEIRLLWSRIF
jgi:hypothetical protein